jgi:uncharacterized membrane protein YfcA
MIFLPALFPFSTAVALCQVIAMASTTFLTIRFFCYIQWKVLMPLLLVSLLTGAIVTISSLQLPKESLQIILGISLVVISIFTVRFSERITVQPTVANGMFLGLIGGTGNGFFGIGGPPVAMYLLSAQLDKRSYLSTIQCYFLLSNISTIMIRTGYGALHWSDAPLIITGWAGIAAGTFFGLKLFKQLPHTQLKKLVYGFVGISGVVLIIQQIM